MAVEESTYTTGRRGVAGTLIVEKMVGRSGAHRGTALGCLISPPLIDDIRKSINKDRRKSPLLTREATEETSVSSVSPPQPLRAVPLAARRRR